MWTTEKVESVFYQHEFDQKRLEILTSASDHCAQAIGLNNLDAVDRSIIAKEIMLLSRGIVIIANFPDATPDERSKLLRAA